MCRAATNSGGEDVTQVPTFIYISSLYIALAKEKMVSTSRLSLSCFISV
jgi:hypothetical protein